MRIGIIVDGDAEYHALHHITRKIVSPNELIAPVKCDIQPYAILKKGPVPPQQALNIVRTYNNSLRLLSPDLLVVLVDKEKTKGCIPLHIKSLQTELARFFPTGTPRVSVVIKNRKFENWLVADSQAIAALKNRFPQHRRIRMQVESNRADQIADAEKLLRDCSAPKAPYRKVQDAIQICMKLDPMRACKHSRSFRKFLREIGCPRYAEQSRSAMGTYRLPSAPRPKS